jgi:hypothetical protein
MVIKLQKGLCVTKIKGYLEINSRYPITRLECPTHLLKVEQWGCLGTCGPIDNTLAVVRLERTRFPRIDPTLHTIDWLKVKRSFISCLLAFMNTGVNSRYIRGKHWLDVGVNSHDKLL